MSTPTQTCSSEELWAEEPSNLDGHARIRARISGLHCSLCTGTIEKALGRQPGVDRVSVSLTHEQALVDYDPAVIQPQQILGTLRDIGYDLYDPRKLRPFEEEEADLVREGKRLLAAIGASLTAIALILEISGVWSVLVPASVVVLMVPLSYALLRPAARVLTEHDEWQHSDRRYLSAESMALLNPPQPTALEPGREAPRDDGPPRPADGMVTLTAKQFATSHTTPWDAILAARGRST